MHAHNRITRAVAATNSPFFLVTRTHVSEKDRVHVKVPLLLPSQLHHKLLSFNGLFRVEHLFVSYLQLPRERARRWETSDF